jgi:hypothetical protein
MSELSIQEQWQPSGDLQEHMDRTQEALAVMQNQVVLPADHRWQLAYALMATGRGQDSGVMAKGTFGTVKTAMGNLMLGPDQRISITGTDTESTLFGHAHPNPTADGPKFVKGKFQVVDPKNPVFYLNELTHMRNQKAVQQLWDGEELLVPTNNSHVDRINLQDAVYYMTSNYPNGQDVFRLSSSIQSRVGFEVLTGDVDDATARKIQSSPRVNFAQAPILPSAEVRRELAGLVEEAYPDPEDSTGTVTGNFTVDLVNRLNESGLVAPISPADRRIGQALAAGSRAYMFAYRNKEGTEITPLVVARVAALVMPTVIKLSHVAEGNMGEYLERNVGDLDKAIAARRIAAREAFRVAYSRLAEDDAATEEGGTALSLQSPEAIERLVDERATKFSYGNHAILGYDVDRAIAGPAEEEEAEAEAPRRILGVRIPRKR